MQWDLNEGRWTTILSDGVVVHAEQVPEGWRILIPVEGWQDTVRNRKLKTWLSAQAIIEQVVRAHYAWESPHGDEPLTPGPPRESSEEVLQRLPWWRERKVQ